MIAADARQVEDEFAAKLASFTPATAMADAPLATSPSELVASVDRWVPEAQETPSNGGEVDKSHLAHPEPRRVRDKEHVRFVAKQPCLVCGRRPSDPHHLRFAQHRAMGRKVSDEFTVPLCRGHHRELHRCGDEAAWRQRIGIEPIAAARALWLTTPPLRAKSDEANSNGTADADAFKVNGDHTKGVRPSRQSSRHLRRPHPQRRKACVIDVDEILVVCLTYFGHSVAETTSI
jgi:hypothetical protein